MGVSLLARMASASQAKANLHPLAFYTIKVTSPRKDATFLRWRVTGGTWCYMTHELKSGNRWPK